MIIYLYVKQHASTGLKYFGKTTRRNPYAYKGSGKYWIQHLKKHGRHVNTLEVWGFTDQTLCTEFALRFSRENHIVESDEWANLCVENGVDGALPGSSLTEEHKKKLSAIAKSRGGVSPLKPSYGNRGKKMKPELQEKLRKLSHERQWSEASKKKLRDAHLGKPHRKEMCPICSKTMSWRHIPRHIRAHD